MVMVIHVTVCGKGACQSLMLVHSSVGAWGAGLKITNVDARNKPMENCLSPLL